MARGYRKLCTGFRFTSLEDSLVQEKWFEKPLKDLTTKRSRLSGA